MSSVRLLYSCLPVSPPRVVLVCKHPGRVPILVPGKVTGPANLMLEGLMAPPSRLVFYDLNDPSSAGAVLWVESAYAPFVTSPHRNVSLKLVELVAVGLTKVEVLEPKGGRVNE